MILLYLILIAIHIDILYSVYKFTSHVVIVVINWFFYVYIWMNSSTKPRNYSTYFDKWDAYRFVIGDVYTLGWILGIHYGNIKLNAHKKLVIR